MNKCLSDDINNSLVDYLSDEREYRSNGVDDFLESDDMIVEIIMTITKIKNLIREGLSDDEVKERMSH